MARAEVAVLGFQAWKKERVDESRAVLEKIQGVDKPVVIVVPGAKTDRKTDPPVRPLGRVRDPKLAQAQLNLEISQELTVNDYFVLYLSQFKSRDAFIEAAKKLNPEESADLMLAYQKHLTSGTELDVPAPTAGLGASSSVISR